MLTLLVELGLFQHHINSLAQFCQLLTHVNRLLAGRTDVEGCCWWGRGVIQTSGVW